MIESPHSPTPTRRTVSKLRQVRLWLAGLFGVRYDGLHHFAVVEPGVLLRCGQPRIRDLEHIRAQHGLATVVAARGGTRHPLRGRWFRDEQRFCRENGVAFVHLPFSDAQAPPADVFDRFLDLIGRPERRPVLVHCEQGFHRTGVLVASFRVRVQRWPIADALREMELAGYEVDRVKRRALLDAFRAWAQRAETGGEPPST